MPLTKFVRFGKFGCQEKFVQLTANTKMARKKQETTKEVRKVAIYCRVSTDQQDREEGGSLDTQEKRCREYCRFENYDIMEVYKDVASGGTMDRPSLRKLFEDAQSGKFQLIVVTKVDRFSRSILDFLNTNETLIKLGVEFYPVDQGIFGTKGPEGELMRNILLAFAQFEREMTRKRTTEGMRAKISRGEWRGGPTPYGYNSKGGRLEIDENEAVIVRRMFSDYLSGRSSYEITDALNKEGLTSKKGNRWSAQGVLRILQNPAYIGKFRDPEDAKSFVQGIHQPIIDEETFSKVESVAEVTRVNHYFNKTLPNEALFASILRCEHCNSAMTPYRAYKNDKAHSYYRCQNAMKRSSSACPLKQVSSVDIEAIGVALLRLLALDSSLLKAVLERVSGNRDDEMKTLRQNRDQISRRITEERRKADNLMKVLENPKATDVQDNILDRIRSANDTIRDMESELAALDRTSQSLKQPVASLPDLEETYRYFWSVWLDMPPEDRRKAIRLIVKEVRLKRQADDRIAVKFELLTETKIKASTGSSGGSGGQVRNIVAHGSAYGIRTRVTGVRGQRPRPLDERAKEDFEYSHLSRLNQANASTAASYSCSSDSINSATEITSVTRYAFAPAKAKPYFKFPRFAFCSAIAIQYGVSG